MATASIFICHAPSDTAFARDLELALETFRLSVWRDNRGLRGGSRLAPMVRWAIEQARQVIVVLGLNTGQLAWLRREIELAQEIERRRESGYHVIPLLLPGTDKSILGQWFSPIPTTAPIQLPADGLGAVLPALLAALGESPPGDVASGRNSPPPVAFELDFSRANALAADWQWTVRLGQQPESTAIADLRSASGALPSPPPYRLQHWYLQSYPCWPTDTLRDFAHRTETLLAEWGRSLHQAVFDAAGLSEPITARPDSPTRRECHLVVRTDTAHPAATAVLGLPWELLRDPSNVLTQGKRPVQVWRSLPGGGEAFLPAPPPLRILAIHPRPDTESTGHSDYRRHTLPLLEAVGIFGKLIELRVLVPPTLAALEKQLNDSWATGQPFTALHLDASLRNDTPGNTILLGFEASHEPPSPPYRQAHFVAATILASLLATYRVRLVVLSAGTDDAERSATVGLASALLAAGIAAVVTLHPDTPAVTQRRFWTTFYEELLHGTRISQALFAGQSRLAGDSYRGLGLGGNVHLQDWFCYNLYLGERDPRLCLRPPSELWHRSLKRARTRSSDRLPPTPSTGFVGRSRDLLRVERLLAEQPTLFLRGPGGSGKTTTAIALADWLARGGRFRHIAYVNGDDASAPRTLLETLGQQLLHQGKHWSTDLYPNLWRALDHLRQTLGNQPALIVLDQLERWPSEHNETFDEFWKVLLGKCPELRLLGLGRLGPPSFAQPWKEVSLSPMDDDAAIRLISQTLISTQEIPPITDNGDSFRQLRDLVALVGGHPGALRGVAREIATRGVNATLALLRPLRTELLRRHPDDPQWPLFLSLELALRRLSATDRERLAILAFFKGGVSRIALGKALQLDTQATDAFQARLRDLELIEERGYGYLSFDPALSHYLTNQLSPSQRLIWQAHWRTGMEQLLEVLYQQYFKDRARTTRVLRLELPNLLALLRDYQQRSSPEQSACLAGQLEQLLADLEVPAALAEVVTARERAGQALSGWTRVRFETERLHVERLRDNGSLENALQAARQLLGHCQAAGLESYLGANYDLARAHLLLGKLLKLSGAAELAVQELSAARQQFHILADAGNVSADRMVAVAEAETGDCLVYLLRLREAGAAYEAALARVGPNTSDLTVAANTMQLGLVRQRQENYSAALALYDTARRMFEALGEPEGIARAWRQLALAHKLNGDTNSALHACQQALYLYEQQRNRSGVAEALNELGHLHQMLNQLGDAALAYRRLSELYAQLGDGLGEEASRNKLANILIQLHQHDEARQELYRASECNPPNSPTTRNWTIRRGLHDVGQTAQNPNVADQARQQAMQKYLAYRRAGGENDNPGARLCAQIHHAVRIGNTATLSAKLKETAASTNVPVAGKLLIAKLQAILAGSRDPALANDPDLHYQYAAELQLLLEELAHR